MKIFRKIIQRIYYWRFYLNVAQIGSDIKLSRRGKFIDAENIIMGNNISIEDNFRI